VTSLSIRGSHVLKPSPDESMTHGGCAVLLPYAGRIRNGTYSYEGRNYSLPRNSEGNAIHGFLKDATMEVRRRTEESVDLQTLLAHPGYPSKLEVKISYRVYSAGFSAYCTVVNVGKRNAPLSIGFHPYFAGGEWRIEHECNVEKLELSDDYFPDGAKQSFNFNGKKFGTTNSFDDCFYFPCDAVLKANLTRLKIRKKNMPYVVVYNGRWAEDKSVAFEPYTSAPDAFNNGYGLVNLLVGRSYDCGFEVELVE
jgi:aldose 1-epimerase